MELRWEVKEIHLGKIQEILEIIKNMQHFEKTMILK